MKHHLLLAALLCLPSLLLQAQTINDENAMKIFASEYMAAYNRQDITALRAMQMRDVVGDSLYHRDHISNFANPAWHQTLPKGRRSAKPTVFFLNNK